MIVGPRKMISKFVLCVSKKVVKEWRISMLVNDMVISWIIVLYQQIKEEKLKERSRETKKQKLVMVTSYTKGPITCHTQGPIIF